MIKRKVQIVIMIVIEKLFDDGQIELCLKLNAINEFQFETNRL